METEVTYEGPGYGVEPCPGCRKQLCPGQERTVVPGEWRPYHSSCFRVRKELEEVL